MAFPPPGADIYRNSEGEVLGWDGPAIDDSDPGDPYDDYDRDGGYDEDDFEGDEEAT